jgi:glycosyltransferase involved in cell wall biosynthesis
MMRLKGKKVVFMMGNLELGGAERQAFLLACYLRDHESAQVEFWGMAVTGPNLIRLLDAEKIPWFVFKEPTRRWLSKIKWTRLWKFLWLARRRKPDILLGYLIESNVLGALYAKKTGAKLFVWNQRDCGLFFRHTEITDRALMLTDNFLSNSEGGKLFLTETGGVPAEKITIIPNAIHLPQPALNRDEARIKYGLEANEVGIAMVANLHESKDHLSLIKAYERLKPEYPEAKLFLAGRWDSTYEKLKLYVDQNGIQGVHFLGSVSDIPVLWQAMDLGVLCSPSEGTPNAVLEAMAMAKPVIGTDIPGIRGALGVQNSPFLVPFGDVDALARVIERFLKDPDLIRSTGFANLERVKSEFMADDIHRRYTQYLIDRLN